MAAVGDARSDLALVALATLHHEPENVGLCRERLLYRGLLVNGWVGKGYGGVHCSTIDSVAVWSTACSNLR